MSAFASQTAAQRSHGRAGLRMGAGGRLRDLHQSGCAKLFLPRGHAPVREAVFVNTAGGLTGGDTLHSAVELKAGAALTCTTQAAERVYRSGGGAACVTAELTLGAGATLAWLPQETILFDRCALDRRVTVDMAEDAELILVEMLTLGRAAMGEHDITAALVDGRAIRRGGRAILHDVQRAALPLPVDPALWADATALATLIVVAPDAEDRLAPLRAALGADGVEAAASVWEGRLMARLLAPEPHRLRRVLARALGVLRDAPPPRSWANQEVAA